MNVIDTVSRGKESTHMTTFTIEEQDNAQPTVPTKEPKAKKKANTAPQKPRVAPAKAKSGKKATPPKKALKAAKRGKPAKTAAGAREGSKTAQILALLQRAKGATLTEIMDATGWQAHSVRGFISGTLGKKLDLPVVSAKREDGQRVYSIAK
jgi:Protein of unknown function (DUF3489)